MVFNLILYWWRNSFVPNSDLSFMRVFSWLISHLISDLANFIIYNLKLPYFCKVQNASYKHKSYVTLRDRLIVFQIPIGNLSSEREIFSTEHPIRTTSFANRRFDESLILSYKIYWSIATNLIMGSASANFDNSYHLFLFFVLRIRATKGAFEIMSFKIKYRE